MLLLASHRERGEREGAIVEGELEGHVHGVEEHLLAHQLDMQLLVIEVTCHLPYLAHRVIDEAPAFAPIMKGQTCVRARARARSSVFVEKFRLQNIIT